MNTQVVLVQPQAMFTNTKCRVQTQCTEFKKASHRSVHSEQGVQKCAGSLTNFSVPYCSAQDPWAWKCLCFHVLVLNIAAKLPCWGLDQGVLHFRQGHGKQQLECQATS